MYANEYNYNSYQHDNYQRLEKSPYSPQWTMDEQLELERDYGMSVDYSPVTCNWTGEHLDGLIFPPTAQPIACSDCPQYHLQILPNLEDYAYEAPTADNRISLLETSEIGRLKYANANEIQRVTGSDNIEKRKFTDKDGSETIGKDAATLNNNVAIADQRFDRETPPHSAKQPNIDWYVRSQDIPVFLNQNKATAAKQPRTEDSEARMPQRKKTAPFLTSITKNNNPEWHSLNKVTNCEICGFPVSRRHSIKHYVDVHPTDEVIPSRVPPNVAAALRDPAAVHRCRREQTNKEICFKQFCYFCCVELSMQRPRWINHMAMHTGHFPFNCTDCSQRFLTKNAGAEKCNLVRVAQPEFDQQFAGVDVKAYLCDLCNFVRFSRTDIQKHLDREHDAEDVQLNFKEVVILSFPKTIEAADGKSYENQHRSLQLFHEYTKTQQNTSEYIKNNNPDWHCLGEDRKCKLCFSQTYISLVSHYVTAHPTREVFSSRVTPAVANFLRTTNHKSEIVRFASDNRLGHQQMCYFCNEVKCYRKCNWIEHVMAHTGDYRHQCTGCLKKYHKRIRHECDRNGVLVRMEQRYFNDIDVMAFLCDLCNYVRFNGKEMQTHLRNEHDGDANNERYRKVVFLRFLRVGRNICNVVQPLTNETYTAEASTVTATATAANNELSSSMDEDSRDLIEEFSMPPYYHTEME